MIGRLFRWTLGRSFCLPGESLGDRAKNPAPTVLVLAVSTPSPAEVPVTRMRLPRRFTPDQTSSVVEVAPKVLVIR